MGGHTGPNRIIWGLTSCGNCTRISTTLSPFWSAWTRWECSGTKTSVGTSLANEARRSTHDCSSNTRVHLIPTSMRDDPVAPSPTWARRPSLRLASPSRRNSSQASTVLENLQRQGPQTHSTAWNALGFVSPNDLVILSFKPPTFRHDFAYRTSAAASKTTSRVPRHQKHLIITRLTYFDYDILSISNHLSLPVTTNPSVPP